MRAHGCNRHANLHNTHFAHIARATYCSAILVESAAIKCDTELSHAAQVTSDRCKSSKFVCHSEMSFAWSSKRNTCNITFCLVMECGEVVLLRLMSLLWTLITSYNLIYAWFIWMTVECGVNDGAAHLARMQRQGILQSCGLISFSQDYNPEGTWRARNEETILQVCNRIIFYIVVYHWISMDDIYTASCQPRALWAHVSYCNT